MSKPQSDAPIRFASASAVKALFVASVRTKEETASIAGAFGSKVKSSVENGNLHGGAFNQAAAIFRKAKNNELKAKEHLAHLRFYLEILDEEMQFKGHTGDLAKMAGGGEAKADEQAPAAETASGGVPLADAQKMFEGTKVIAENRKAAAKKLDIPALDPDAAPADAVPPPPPVGAAAESVEKPKRGRPKKDAALVTDAAPPPPPAAVPTLADDDDEDIRPGFLKAKDAERKAAAVH